MQPSGTGLVLEPGARAPETSLKGRHNILIHSIADDGLVRIQYVDGFVKHHQVESVDQLLPQITNVLRRKYGADNVSFTKLPKAIEPGEKIGVKI